MKQPKKLSVLFVDDTPDDVENVAEFMKYEGWATRCVESGEECLELLRGGEKFGVIVLDAQLKAGMLHGMEVLARILAELPQQCVVFLSGKEIEAHHAISASQAGAIDYIQKSVKDIPEFIERMKRAITVCRERFEAQGKVIMIAKAVFHQVLPRIEAAYFRTESVEAASTDDAVKEQLGKIKVNLMQAENYLRRLTEFDPQAIQESTETTDLRAEVRKGVDNIIQLLELKLDKPSVSFTKPDEGPKAYIRFDSRWPSLITEILVQNAADAVLASDAKKEVRVNVQENPENKDEWLLVVEDTGFGIPEEVRSKLGQPGVTTKKGMGLGLYLVNQVANTKVENLAPGTRITVSFPKA